MTVLTLFSITDNHSLKFLTVEPGSKDRVVQVIGSDEATIELAKPLTSAALTCINYICLCWELWLTYRTHA